ncbi:hypothetical protein CR513_44780, partial [Mucuna pruriens]
MLQKMTNPNRKGWRQLLEDALWAHRTAYRTPLGMSPYKIVFGKACHLPVGEQRKFQLQELDKLRLETYENSQIYKQKVKRFHDQQVLRKEFQVGQKVLLFNSHLKLIVELKDEQPIAPSMSMDIELSPAPTASNMETISLMEPAPPDDTL